MLDEISPKVVGLLVGSLSVDGWSDEWNVCRVMGGPLDDAQRRSLRFNPLSDDQSNVRFVRNQILAEPSKEVEARETPSSQDGCLRARVAAKTL